MPAILLQTKNVTYGCGHQGMKQENSVGHCMMTSRRSLPAERKKITRGDASIAERQMMIIRRVCLTGVMLIGFASPAIAADDYL